MTGRSRSSSLTLTDDPTPLFAGFGSMTGVEDATEQICRTALSLGHRIVTTAAVRVALRDLGTDRGAAGKMASVIASEDGTRTAADIVEKFLPSGSGP